MGTEDNKRLVELLNSHYEHSDIDAILGLLADDATWWVNAKPHLFPVAGTLTKAQYGDVLREVRASLDGGMRMEVSADRTGSARVRASRCSVSKRSTSSAGMVMASPSPRSTRERASVGRGSSGMRSSSRPGIHV